MEIKLLGWVEIHHDGKTVPVMSRQARTLLALLALAPGRAVSTDRLIDQLWPESELANARNALQATVTRLRRALRAGMGDAGREDQLLRTVDGGYLLDICAADVDAFDFTAAISTAEAIGQSDPARGARMITSAVQVWRGPALDGVSDAPELRAERVRLEEHRTTALELLAGMRLSAGELRSAICDLSHLVEIHQEREHLNELLMMALYLDGRQTEALDVFRRVRNRLRHELGVEPSLRLRHMHQAILTHDPKLIRRQSALNSLSAVPAVA